MHFEGDTYVAFSDLCGFKMMMKDRNRAYEALDFLFNTVYRLQRGNHNVNALAVSDCVISWAAINEHKHAQLREIVQFAENLHRELARERYLMTTTISYGDFRYEDRIQLSNLQKSLLMGGAYVDAFLKNAKSKVGRILLLNEGMNHMHTARPDVFEPWKWMKKKHGWEYFWPTNRLDDIARLKGMRANQNNNYEPLKDLLCELVQARSQRQGCHDFARED